MKRASLLFAIALPMGLTAQVRVDSTLQLTGGTDSLRQVYGLSLPGSGNDALTAAMEQSGQHRSAAPLPGAIWAIVVESLDGPPVPGTQLLVRVPAPEPQPLLSVNGEGPWPIVLHGAAQLDSTLTSAGTWLSLIFDGAAFQVMNGRVRTAEECPSTMVAAPGGYCIDREETEALDFPTASLHCGTQGKRICSWGEFHAACEQRVELELNDMLNNWEWTNSTADSNQQVRAAGNGSCTAAQRVNGTTTTRAFRCCFTR